MLSWKVTGLIYNLRPEAVLDNFEVKCVGGCMDLQRHSLALVIGEFIAVYPGFRLARIITRSLDEAVRSRPCIIRLRVRTNDGLLGLVHNLGSWDHFKVTQQLTSRLSNGKYPKEMEFK